MQKSELLSPAGNMQAVVQAVQNGADAVYLGGRRFGARAFADNFSYDEMAQAIYYAHTWGVRVYVTVNTLVYEQETAEFLAHVEKIYRLGADALIMQDTGMISLVRRRFPDVPVHASTQMHNHNDACLYFVSKLGAARAVLAREMDLEQIGSLSCGIEKEVFVHGALCICYSGQCLLSALTQGRSGNRGQCAQSCRMRYRLVAGGGRRLDRDGDYLLSPKDLGLFEEIGRLLDAGVHCLKIEGRMKSPEYVGQATKIYAGLLSDYENGRTPGTDAGDVEDLSRLFNRGFTQGHLLGAGGGALMGTLRPNHRGVPLGRVVSAGQDRIRLKLTAPLHQGDGIKFEKSDEGFICNRIYKDGRLTAAAEAGEVIGLDGKARVQPGETVVKTSDVLLIKRLRDAAGQRKVCVSGKLVARKAEPLCLTLRDGAGHSATACGEAVQPSRTSPVTKQALSKSMARLGDTPYALEELDIDCDAQIFVAKSALNALRRQAVQQLTAQRTQMPPRRAAAYTPPPVRHNEDTAQVCLHVLVRSKEQLDAVQDIVTGDIYTSDRVLYDGGNPGKMRLKTDKLAKTPEAWRGERLLVTDHGGLYLYPGKNDITADYSLGALNARTLGLLTALGARRIALSPELDIAQTQALIDGYRKANGQAPVLEAIAYARCELMGMQHCVISGTHGRGEGCALCKTGRYYLEDAQGRRFPVVTDAHCNNYLLDCVCRQPDILSLRKLGIRHFRIELLDEDAGQSRDIVRRFLQQIGS